MLLLCVLGVFGAKQIGDHSDINEHPAQSVSILQTQKQTAAWTWWMRANERSQQGELTAVKINFTIR